jgi:putative ABC transport system permease protein
VNFFESLSIALKAIRVNKMRSILTMLGIIIGIASVIAVFAIGNGGEAAINKEFESFGVNRLMLWHNWNEEISNRDIMTLDDMDAISRNLGDDIVAISPTYNESMSLVQKMQKKDDKGTTLTVNGVNAQYDKIQKIDILSGRFLIDSDDEGARSVIVIDDQLALDTFGTTDVIGEKMTVSYYNQRLSYVIVGIYEAPKASLFSGFETSFDVYIPYNTLARTVGLGDNVYMAEINTNPDSSRDKIEDKILKVLTQRHRNDSEKYRVYSAESEMEIVNQVTGVITGIISAIAAISLLVGGIGVMNIMLVSVTERTREIGIRKALGASRRDILMQFLVEAVIISLIGGIIGTAIGAGIAAIVAFKLSLPPVVPVNAVILAWVFSAGVGIFFGMYPANQAAKLDPIEALRYE